MIHDFQHDYVPLRSLMHDRVEEPPKARQVLDEEVGGPIVIPEEPRD